MGKRDDNVLHLIEEKRTCMRVSNNIKCTNILYVYIFIYYAIVVVYETKNDRFKTIVETDIILKNI